MRQQPTSLISGIMVPWISAFVLMVAIFGEVAGPDSGSAAGQADKQLPPPPEPTHQIKAPVNSPWAATFGSDDGPSLEHAGIEKDEGHFGPQAQGQMSVAVASKRDDLARDGIKLQGGKVGLPLPRGVPPGKWATLDRQSRDRYASEILKKYNLQPQGGQ